MKKALLILSALTIISSCAFVKDVQQNSAVNVVVPKAATQTLLVTAKFWNMGELAKKYAPAKLEDFVIETEKYCKFKIVNFPKTANDTLELQLKCDTIGAKALTLFKKKK